MNTIRWRRPDGTTVSVTANTEARALEIARAHGYRPAPWWAFWRRFER